MTQQEFTKLSLNLLRSMVRQKYSQDTIEHALNLLIPMPREEMPETVRKFTVLADQGLSEIDFRYETSQVFLKVMKYENKNDVISDILKEEKNYDPAGVREAFNRAYQVYGGSEILARYDREHAEYVTPDAQKRNARGGEKVHKSRGSGVDGD